MTTRRERLRAATYEEIKTAALAQITAVGGSSLSLRGVAREIGMSPAGLYRYYDGRDELLTDLITDAYNDLATTVESAMDAGGDSMHDRFAEGMRAYRRWGLEFPNRFLLIFGTPIPGYEAPEAGSTVEGNRRMGEAFFAVGAEAWRRGQLSVPTSARTATKGERDLAFEIDPQMPPQLVPVMLGTWAHFHGLVTLEVLGQFQWLYGDRSDVLFESEIERLLAGIGLMI
ncbi:MAG: TetR/AcrR family transcriptional regulator [Actinomycetia bacterium]|nr:TetR/AcrR family transcriptional regulator [Actinomycetes bacterium]